MNFFNKPYAWCPAIGIMSGIAFHSVWVGVACFVAWVLMATALLWADGAFKQ